MKSLSVEDWQGKIVITSLGDWANKYLDHARTHFARKTFLEKVRVFRLFFSSISPTLPVDQLTKGMVSDYLQVQTVKRSGYSVNADRKNLMSAWHWGVEYMGLPSLNPCNVKRFPETRSPRYIPPEKDFYKLLGVVKDDQDRLLLLAYLYLAARKSELFRLKWDDVDFSNCRVRLFTRKRKDGSMEADILPMTDEIFNAFLIHRQGSKSQYVFVNLVNGEPFVDRKRWMRGLCKKVGVKPFGLHAIRHLTASILAREGVPAIQIQAILRHKKITTTERYLHRLNDLKPALELISNKFPSKAPSQPMKEKTPFKVILPIN